MRQMSVVALIPAFEPKIGLCCYVDELIACGFYQVVVVDDGSSAQYQNIFSCLSEKESCVVLHHSINQGKGAALKTGYKWIEQNEQTCFGVITADSDGQHTATDCKKLAETLISGNNALYLGSRSFNEPQVPTANRFGNKITRSVFQILYGESVPDTQTGLRGFRREELPFMRSIPGERFEYEMNVLIACSKRRLPIIPVEIETVYTANAGDTSHFDKLWDSARIYKAIFQNFFRFMGASMLCFLLDWGLATLIGDVLLPNIGVTNLVVIAWVSGLVARLVSGICNFFLNKKFVFQHKGHTAHNAWRYTVLCVGIICASNLGVSILGTIFLVPRWLGKGICDFLLYFVSYRVQNTWVFQKSQK